MKFIKNRDNDKEDNKFVQIIKSKWLLNGSLTFLMIAIIIASFIALNLFLHNLHLIPIDLSQEKLFTLSDDSKEKVKNVNKDVYVYFVGYQDDDSTIDLARQYTSANEKIKIETVNATSRPDLVEKYGIENGSEGIIIANGENYKVLAATDLYTYDSTTGQTVDITEQKLTNAIMTVNSEKVPKVYFLKGYSNQFDLSYNMNYLNLYLSNEINEVATLDVLSQGKIPDDCDTLVVCTPTKDFDEMTANAIINYINSGKNILWLNAALGAKADFPNVNKILAMYGVKPFEPGYIMETDASKMLSDTPYIISPDMSYSPVTKDLMKANGVRFITATKINLANSEELDGLKVVQSDILKSSDKSFFRTDLSRQGTSREIDEQPGGFVVGTELKKTISEGNEEQGTKAVVSKMIIYGENIFITDYPVNNSTPILTLAHNKDLILNSMAYLVDREEDITVRKNTSVVRYQPTKEQDLIIRTVIFAVPLAIIAAGLIIWILRRRKK